MSNFMKILPVGAELFHADGRTDSQRRTYTTKLTASFRNFAKRPKKTVRLWGDINECVLGTLTKQ